MAGGRDMDEQRLREIVRAAMEPRPDGRGKVHTNQPIPTVAQLPQWSPGLMAGGRAPDGSPWESRYLSGDFERSQRRWVIAS